MPLREELESTGNWLFKRRSFIPLVLCAFAIAVMYFYPDTTHTYITCKGWRILCLSLTMAGLVIRALTVGFTPKGTSGRNTEHQVAEQLNQTGLYSLVRHPLYLGNFLMWFGLFLYIGIWWFVVICCLAFWLYYERIMFSEEEFLRKRYGSQYEDWASRTPAFLPRLSGYQPTHLNFSFLNVLKREYNGIFAAIFSFTALNGISYYFVSRIWYIDMFWQVCFVIGVFLFVLLRFLKKRTRMLEVQGR
jgi:protein-S-isoprenylcysteine O-methyltransferase Ste14